MDARSKKRLGLALAIAGAVLALWLLAVALLIGSTLPEAERAQALALLATRWPLALLAWVLALLAAAVGLQGLLRRYVGGPARLLEETRVLVDAQAPQDLSAALRAPGGAGTPECQALAGAIAELAAQRDRLRQDMAAQVAEASRSVQQEKNRLAALMAELTQSVVVCNLDGRILLYNSRARLQFRALSKAPALVDGAELMGIGRSIYGVFDRQLVAHALDTVAQRMARGAVNPSAQFVTTTPSGQLLRVQLAPVRATQDDGAMQQAPGAMAGFVLMLDNVTRSYEQDSLRDQLLHELTERSRASLGSMQAALDMLSLEDTEPVMRERFLGVLREELAQMGQRITDLSRQSAEGMKTRWPMEDMLGNDLLGAAARQVERITGRPLATEATDASLWLKVDSFALLQALSYLAWRLVDEFDVRYLQLRLSQAGPRAQLDLIWTGQAISTETVMSWEAEAMRFADQSSPLSVRDVVERHGGEMWFERDRVRQQALFRFLLPLASAHEQMEASALLHSDSRPEYYDFDLFQSTEAASPLDDRPLAEVRYTVFDTETTGLNPSAGDEIIQIGAVRIVNGKVRRQEAFDHLVNPGRAIPAASIPIHGITEAMVAGKPRLAAVLPAFHAFAEDTVLVAHNAAFDMKFLHLQESATGLVFSQPVLDTLLLSAVVHPNQDSHRLEAIAERLNITVLGRHTALGDALMTAEVWLRLIPLLQAMGIRTLRQAREAAQKTYYARIKY